MEERERRRRDVHRHDQRHRAATTMPTTKPRVTPPKARPSVSSSGLKGGISRSTMLPWNLAIISDEVVLAKAFCTIAIMMSPGARNSRKGAPCDDALLPAQRQEEDGEEQQRRHHRRRDRLHRHLEEALHLAQIERPQPEPVDRAEAAHARCQHRALVSIHRRQLSGRPRRGTRRGA